MDNGNNSKNRVISQRQDKLAYSDMCVVPKIGTDRESHTPTQ